MRILFLLSLLFLAGCTTTSVTINEGIPECEPPKVYILFTVKGCMTEAEWLALRPSLQGE